MRMCVCVCVHMYKDQCDLISIRNSGRLQRVKTLV